jgi:hypothetical protein
VGGWAGFGGPVVWWVSGWVGGWAGWRVCGWVDGSVGGWAGGRVDCWVGGWVDAGAVWYDVVWCGVANCVVVALELKGVRSGTAVRSKT